MMRFAFMPFAGLLALLIFSGTAGGALAQQASQDERIQRLEEHMLDLNSMIATLQSLVSQGGTASPAGMAPPQVPMAQPGSMSGGGDQRIDALETQIRALTGQLEQMGQQIAQLQASMGGGQPPSQQGLRGSVPDQQQGFTLQDQGNTFGQTSVQPGDGYQQQAYQAPQQSYDNQQQAYSGQQNYGQQQTYSGQQDSFANPPSQQQPASPWAQGFGQGQSPQVAALPSGDSQAAYDSAYNSLLKRDFGAAEQGFRDFLQQHPNDPLAGNAQYWLGETYYVRGQFREAADSFLAGYRNHGNSDKAPANLLKLGMSLHRLGEQDAACSSFSELEKKYPNAPSHLKQRAAAERDRSGC